MTRSLIVVLAVLLFAVPGCGGDDGEAESPPATTDTAQEAPTWEGPTQADEQGSVDVDAFNSYVTSVGGDLARSPRAQAEAFPGAAFESAQKSVELEERGNQAEATVTVEGLQDDSIHSQRWELDFARTGDVWTVTSARFSQRCHEGRGHQEYSPELCL